MQQLTDFQSFFSAQFKPPSHLSLPSLLTGANNTNYGASPTNKQLLTDDEILGNAFVFILAGHETAANTIHFSLLFLALHPSSQRRLQKDLDKILGDKPISEWNYEEDDVRGSSKEYKTQLDCFSTAIPPPLYLTASFHAFYPLSVRRRARSRTQQGLSLCR